MRKIFLVSLLFISVVSLLSAQEFNANFHIDAKQTGQQNQQVFKTLEQQLSELINNTSWTNERYELHERISCDFTLLISSFDSSTFRATLQVQAVRPVFGSMYTSQIYNINDRQVVFDYTEHEALEFNINSSESNIVSIIAYHLYTILGLDADTFEENGGEPYFATARQIVNTASGGNYAGWSSSDGTQTRYSLNDALLSSVYSDFHQAMYLYHRQGLDLMHKDPKEAKENIVQAISVLRSVNDKRPNSYLLRTFFDAKSNEIQTIFSDGPSVDIAQLIDNLNRIAPTKRKEWGEIRF
ncbi:MAG TPA: DUF4835 family protein [Flavobacteriaceae bacterium]|nr:DUF4835 family protein [Flavobacteriaceae bacterium]